jgi:ribosomal protein L18E
MACGSCGGGKPPIRVERSTIHTKPKKIVRVPAERLGSRKIRSRVPIASVEPANNLDKHRA